MICKPCGEAGDILAMGRHLNPNLRRLSETVAQGKHQECPGPGSCDCLHRLGPPPLTKAV